MPWTKMVVRECRECGAPSLLLIHNSDPHMNVCICQSCETWQLEEEPIGTPTPMQKGDWETLDGILAKLDGVFQAEL